MEEPGALISSVVLMAVHCVQALASMRASRVWRTFSFIVLIWGLCFILRASQKTNVLVVKGAGEMIHDEDPRPDSELIVLLCHATLH